MQNWINMSVNVWSFLTKIKMRECVVAQDSN